MGWCGMSKEFVGCEIGYSSGHYTLGPSLLKIFEMRRRPFLRPAYRSAGILDADIFLRHVAPG